MDQGALVGKKVEAFVSHAPLLVPHDQGGAAAPGKMGSLHASSPIRGRRRLALLLSIGGTILSALGFIAFSLFEQYNDGLAELRHDLKHFNETSADLVKREQLGRLREHLKECYQELHAASEGRLLMQKELQASETARKEIALELQRLRERLACVEGRQSAPPLILQIPSVSKTAK
jgi:hypothetical protein